MIELNNTQVMLLQQRQKSAVVAVTLNILWLGLGSLYARRWVDAAWLCLLVGPVLAILVAAYNPAFALVVVVAIVAGVESVRQCNIKIIQEAVK